MHLPAEGMGELFTSPVTLGVIVGLVLGKPLGITAFAWLAVRSGLGRLAPDMSWHAVIGVGSLAGIGFTVALFVTSLAFTEPALTDAAKVGILAASLLAGLIGAATLIPAGPAARRRAPEKELVSQPV